MTNTMRLRERPIGRMVFPGLHAWLTGMLAQSLWARMAGKREAPREVVHRQQWLNTAPFHKGES